jgi:predicted nucleic acid-binding protein
MNVVDSSAWLEYFAGSDQAKHFARAIESTEELIVPVIVIYEVFIKIAIEKGEDNALIAIAYMKQGYVAPVDDEIALHAAKVAIDNKLPMADSLIYAITLKHNATLYTQDKHFENINSVKYFPARKEGTT